MKKFISVMLSILIVFSTAYVGSLPVKAATQGDAVIAIARGQKGYHGRPNTFSNWMGIPYGDWCAAFACWCAEQAGVSKSVVPKIVSSTSLLVWYNGIGRWHRKNGTSWSYNGKTDNSAVDYSYIPQAGDIILVETNSNYTDGPDHTALVTGYSGGVVYTIEGNITVGGVSNQVAENSYSASSSRIWGYCNPAYIGSGSSGTWVSDSKGWWYQRSDGSYPCDQWEFIEGYWYYFDSTGYMVTGWQKLNGDWYYMYPEKTTDYYGNVYPEGAMATYWLEDGETWYYMGEDGAMRTDWQFVDNQYYYFDNSGAMLTGKHNIDGHYFYFYKEAGTSRDGQVVAKGQMAYKWILDGDNYYYADSNGYLYTGWHQMDGDWFHFNSEGVMAVGWRYLADATSNDAWYYFNSDDIGTANRGKMVTGWHDLKSSKGDGFYYFREEREEPWGKGSMVTGPKWIDNCFINEDGLCLTNQWVDNDTYYVDENGYYVTSTWIGDSYAGADGKKVKNAWQDGYYLDASGVKATNAWVDNNQYYVGADGTKITNTWQDDYYLQADGTKAVNEWVDEDNYYVGADGKMVKGWQIIDDIWYFFDEETGIIQSVLEKGDVNCDGMVDIKDATALQKLLASGAEYEDYQKYSCDTNSDGYITVTDVTFIQKYCAGLIEL